MNDADLVTFKLFKYERETEAASYKQFDHLFPLNKYAGFHSYFAGAPANMSFLTLADYENYLVSLADFPRFNQAHITNLRAAIDKGYTHYCESVTNYEKTISKHIVLDVNQSVFHAPIARMPNTISANDQARITKSARQLIRDVIIPEYQRFFTFFTTEYMPNCRQDVGITALEDGKDYYQYLIEYYTTTQLSADQIHQMGLDEVARIKAEMNTIINQLEFKGNFTEFVSYLRTEPAFYTDSEQDLLEKASYITRKAAAQLPKWFGLLPRSTFDIKPSPDGGAYYVAPDGSGTTSGTYFIDTQDLKSQPLYNLEALTLHEAEPGHHFQSSIAMELDVPEFRKTLYHSAYGEGWGLYSERLGKEMGFYQDPYSDFGRLTYEMWRACRLVVDTGMHAQGWSREKAIDYLAAHTALSMADVVAQIDRYITWPAQALSYKIGELKIRELRQRAEIALGVNFDVRAFHDQILRNGSLPLATLEELFDRWLAQQQAEVHQEK
ncbi:hypothetical protein GCM10008090_06950 [Arenicella chitinivorans]|uniref:DUF885 domain-containing protein n=2 Tax=Arenicella chitinivorans TaxID=1329800 RepID=A0A918VH09_9GAMM|nr:hypothetical protein GCM10008090_06950 [Arenicella chitinivorans]